MPRQSLSDVSAAGLPGSASRGEGGGPHWALVHAALISVQLIFGVGAVIGKLGVEKFNPILFVAIRDGVGGPLLTLAAVLLYCLAGGPPPVPRARDVPRFMLAGICLYSSQAFFIVGEKLSSAVIGSARQPAQPILTTVIAVSLGWEPLTLHKTLGILFAFTGAAFMVFYEPASGHHDGGGASASGGGSDADPTTASKVIGNSMFFINCMGTSLYVIFSKPLVQEYTTVAVTAWAYLFGKNRENYCYRCCHIQPREILSVSFPTACL
eukprot:COSAG06_NODE_14901_length_1115_cov_2.319882_1_plen_266_part_10